MLHEVSELRVERGHRLWIRFADGVEGVVDLSSLVGRGVFALLADEAAFAGATIDEFGAVCWPNGADGCRLRVDSFQGLLVKYAVEQEADAIVRGIRAVSDYEYELQMALMNRRLEPRIETVFMMAAEDYSYASSRLVKEVYQLGGTIHGLVPPSVEARMKRKFGDG